METNNKKANGGNARAIKLSPERRKEIAQKAAASRWNKERAPIDIAVRVLNILKTSELVVAASGRRGENGLKNAEEIAARIAKIIRRNSEPEIPAT